MSAATASPGRIETAQGLFEALRAPDLRTRIAVIGGLARDPRAGLLLGRHEGRDVIDALIKTIEKEPAGSGLGRPLSQILSAYADPRVEAFFAGLLEKEEEFDLIEVAAGYLARTEGGHGAVRAFLFRTGRPHHAQAAARALLTARVELPPRERLRAALLEDAEPPPLTADTLACWLDELVGPLRRRALARLRSQDETALCLLMDAWDRLDAEARVVVLCAARERAPAAVLPVLPSALASPELALSALECLDALGPAGDALRPPLSAFLGHGPALLAAALAVARLDVDPRLALAPEQDAVVRCAALRRVAREEGEGTIPLLLSTLMGPEWALRAAAAQLLSGLGERAREAVRPFAGHADPALRLAAAQVLTGPG